MDTKKWSLALNYLFVLLVLLLAIFLLTPRHWEPTAESWKQWGAARILRETGGFPVLTIGPLYVTYLQLFSPLPYPWSVQLEYLLTHLFTYVALFLLLRRLLPMTFALLLTVAWIPHLAIIEPGGAVLGIGLLAIYLIPGRSYLRNDGYLPLPLFAAALSHSIYIAFLFGHILGKLWQRWRGLSSKYPLQFYSPTQSMKDTSIKYIKSIFLVVMFSLAVLTLVQPSPRMDHNHLLMDQTYAPVSLRNLLTFGFFQYGDDRYVKQTYPKEEWASQDWYFTNPKAFHGATTIFSAVIKAPTMVMRSLISNLGLGIQIPSYFLAGKYLGLISILLWLLPLVGMVGLIQIYTNDKPKLFSIFFGTAAAVSGLGLVTFNTRYIVTLLPVWLLLLCYFFLGARKISEKIRDYSLRRPALVQKIILLCGLVFIVAAFFLDAKFVTSHIVPYSYEDMRQTLRLQIIIFRIALVIVGISLTAFRQRILFLLSSPSKKTSEKETLAQESSGAQKSLWTQKHLQRGTLFLVLISSLLLLLTSPYPSVQGQFAAVLEQRDFLSGDRSLSMIDAYPEVREFLSSTNIVFASEYVWLMAFTEAGIDHVQQIWSFPPFKSDAAESLLEKADVIMVSKTLVQEKASVGTQEYLRYLLHIKPFLEKKMEEGTLLKKELPKYGTIYIKKKGRLK